MILSAHAGAERAFNPAARGEKARHFSDQLARLSERCALKPTYAAGTGRAFAGKPLGSPLPSFVHPL